MKVGMYVARAEAPVVVEAAQALERHGADCLWHDESLWYRGTMSLLSACAARTETLRLGVASINPYVIHPTYFAMQYATLAELSQGRAAAGIGAGVESWLEQLGLKQSLPRTSVKEAIEIARLMLAGEKVTYGGRAFNVEDVELAFRSDHPAPLFWGAMGERSIETCGEVAEGWVISIMEPTAYVERGFERLRAGAEAAGRTLDGFEVVQYQAFACDEDPAKARSLAKDLIATIFRLEFEFCLGQESLMKALSADLEGISMEDYATVMRRLADGVPPEEAVPDSLVAQTAIAGTPEECAEQLRRYEEIGVTETALISAVFDVHATAKVIGEQIKPLLAGPTEVAR